MSDAVDLYVVYAVLKKLTTPFEQWPAYKDGIIDKEGNQLKLRENLTAGEKKNFSYLDLMVLNMKRMLEKLPGGASKIGSYAAALLLMKQYPAIKKESEQLLLDLPVILEDCVLEARQRLEEDAVPVNSAGGGAIAGIGVGPQGEPGLTPKQRKHYKDANAEDVQKTVLPAVAKIRRLMAAGSLKT